MTEGAAANQEPVEAPDADEVPLNSDEERLAAIRDDPYGYSVRIREKFQAEAAEWVRAEAARRLEEDRQRRHERAKSFGRWLLHLRGRTAAHG